jgi:hypothetical protein
MRVRLISNLSSSDELAGAADAEFRYGKGGVEALATKMRGNPKPLVDTDAGSSGARIDFQ